METGRVDEALNLEVRPAVGARPHGAQERRGVLGGGFTARTVLRAALGHGLRKMLRDRFEFVNIGAEVAECREQVVVATRKTGPSRAGGGVGLGGACRTRGPIGLCCPAGDLVGLGEDDVEQFGVVYSPVVEGGCEGVLSRGECATSTGR